MLEGRSQKFLKGLLSPALAKILPQVCNAVTRHSIELESYPNHPRIQQVFCLKSKKTVFVFGLGFAGVTAASGCVLLFLATFTWPWTPTIGPLFWLKIFWKLSQNPRL